MRHPMTVLVTVFAITATIAAREPQPALAGPSVLRQFVASVPNTVPAEFAADLLLRAADSERADAEGHDWLVSTYQRAFTLAGYAPDVLARRMLPWAHPDTREAIATAGYGYGLDTVSLQARAVQGLLRVEPRRALTLLEQITFQMPALSCVDTLMYDVTAPYRALTAVVRHFHHSPFGAKDVESAARARKVLSARLVAITSSTEIAPAVEALKAVALPAMHAQPMWMTMVDRLRAIRDDDRTFSASLSSNGMEIEQAIPALDALGADSALSVLDAYKSYLVTHLSARRCSLARSNVQAIVSMEAHVIDGINDALVRHRLRPIAASERRGSHTIPSARMGELWQSPQAAYLHDTLQGLLITWPDSAADEAARAENQRVLTDFMNRLRGWSPRHERSASEYFHQQLRLLSQLANLETSVRPHALRQSIALLAATSGHVPSVEWFAHVGELLDAAASPDDQGVTLRLLEESEHPVLTRYGQLQTFSR